MSSLRILLVLFFASTLHLRAADTSDDALKRLGPDFKKPIEVPDSFFNPFKIQSVNELAPRKKEVAAVTNEQVAEAIGKRAISAILYSPDPKRNRAVIGDQNFEFGDELVFMGEKGQREPLVAGVSVFLREIGEKTLQIEIATQGEASRMMAFSLRDFYRQ